MLYVINMCLLTEVSDIHSNCSAAQACNRRPLAENRPIRSQASPCGLCGEKNWNRGTSSENFDFLLPLSLQLTVYGLDGPGIESRCGEISGTIPDRP